MVTFKRGQSLKKRYGQPGVHFFNMSVINGDTNGRNVAVDTCCLYYNYGSRHIFFFFFCVCVENPSKETNHHPKTTHSFLIGLVRL